MKEHHFIHYQNFLDILMQEQQKNATGIFLMKIWRSNEKGLGWLEISDLKEKDMPVIESFSSI